MSRQMSLKCPDKSPPDIDIDINIDIKIYINLNTYKGELMEKYLPVVCTRLKELRISRNYTQGKLAELFNISKQSICNYENNMREPDMEILKKYSDLFEVSIDYLFGKNKKGMTEVKRRSEAYKNENFMKTLNMFNSIEFKEFLKVIHKTLGIPMKTKKVHDEK